MPCACFQAPMVCYNLTTSVIEWAIPTQALGPSGWPLPSLRVRVWLCGSNPRARCGCWAPAGPLPILIRPLYDQPRMNRPHFFPPEGETVSPICGCLFEGMVFSFDFPCKPHKEGAPSKRPPIQLKKEFINPGLNDRPPQTQRTPGARLTS